MTHGYGKECTSETQKEILELLKRDRESSNGAAINGGGTMINSIEQTQRVINNFESDLTALKAKKQKLVNNGGVRMTRTPRILKS